MQQRKHQKGMSVMSWLLVLALAAFLASAAFKVIPHYLDFMALEKMVMAIESPQGQGITSPGDVYGHVGKGMQVNSIRDLDLEKAMAVEQEGNDFKIKFDYERREPLIKNIDLVVKFQKEFRVRAPQ
ncbi:DUF4845 domain-containing protein [Atopomonas sediminilitoris]|uniref:DUF4845 domain-containing protein n=1 Tax=Atopomonas sediminilitoris TaxID=2919919 RepID=UPI001F4D4737|nr:DUF4845 domain-containing protein [Atopomonas sediminilitoris]MCJ8168592.1 DUF4845 domain-containing protein [Atopomonas sediminilitoris]